MALHPLRSDRFADLLLNCAMRIDDLVAARLKKRYKRFLADVVLDDGQEITVHCPNPGSMKGCLEEGERVYLKDSRNPKRKLRYTWSLIDLDSSPVIVDTGFANKFVKAIVQQGLIKELDDYGTVLSEPPYGEGRFDLLLTNRKLDLEGKKKKQVGGPIRKAEAGDCFVEIKSTTLKEGSTALFPDAKTDRGRKHLERLVLAKEEGIRAIQFYLVNRQDTESFEPARQIDPLYSEALFQSSKKEVEVLAYDIKVEVTESEEAGLYSASVALGKRLPVRF